jgi:hypothetical protein
VGAHALVEAVVDRAQLELDPLEGAEGALGLGERLVGADDIGGGELRARDARAQDVDPVEGGLGGDLVLLAPVGEAVVLDLELEVLTHLEAVPDLADGEPDLRFAPERSRLDPRLDRGQFALGGGEQLLTAAAPVVGDERVTADDQPLARVIV